MARSHIQPVLDDFWAAWCGHNTSTAAAARVTGPPTLNIYVNGEVFKSITGARPKAARAKEIAELL
ncbi:hypothetical protein [Aeromicrobium sp.]|uniref:thioredoxin family protein n=1 Tax=Aeromicrobium sp. TaxID=1871063 RepID=UPI0019BD79F7|nr:hypothetical protein [Aeromicrobium sp.]MBC7632091.1 hypothetical protein [Aeromicrobium sp.]